MSIIAEQGSRRRAAKKSKKITIRSKAIDDFDRPEITLRFNALNHVLVPHQELVGAANISEEEQFEVESEALSPWKMVQPDDETGEDRLAKELASKDSDHRPRCSGHQGSRRSRRPRPGLRLDPDHKPLAAGWIADRVLKVVRQSPSAGRIM